jgi:DNA-binding beta-propeller fold protein YncE
MWRSLIHCFLVLIIGSLGASNLSAQTALLVSSGGTSQVLRYDGVTGAFLGISAAGGGLNTPAGLAINPNNGNLLVVSTQTNNVLQYNPFTGSFINTFNSGGTLTLPDGMSYGPDGHLYVSGGTANNVQRFNGVTGSFINNFATGAAGNLFAAVFDVRFGPNNDLYFSNQTVNFPTGSFSGVRRHNGTTGAHIWNTSGGSLGTPSGIAFGADGLLYVASASGDNIQRFNATTGAFVDTFVPTGSGGLDRPYGITFGPDGHLYVTSYSGTTATSMVKRYHGTTGAFIDNFVAPGSGGLTNPTYLLFVDFTPIPEPTGLLLGGAGVAAALWLGKSRPRRR